MASTYTLSTNNKHVRPSKDGHLYLQTGKGEFKDLGECSECKLEGDISFNTAPMEDVMEAIFTTKSFSWDLAIVYMAISDLFIGNDEHIYLKAYNGENKDLGYIGNSGCIPMSEIRNRMRIKALEERGFEVVKMNSKSSSNPPLPVDILRRGRCTIVKWNDGTTTKVVLEEGKADTGIFGAFCIAFAKKMYGSTEKLLKHIDNADEKARAVRVKAAAQECQEQCKKRAEARRKEKFEREVAEEMHQARVRDEAMRRLWDKEKGKGEWME